MMDYDEERKQATEEERDRKKGPEGDGGIAEELKRVLNVCHPGTLNMDMCARVRIGKLWHTLSVGEGILSNLLKKGSLSENNIFSHSFAHVL